MDNLGWYISCKDVVMVSHKILGTMSLLYYSVTMCIEGLCVDSGHRLSRRELTSWQTENELFNARQWSFGKAMFQYCIQRSLVKGYYRLTLQVGECGKNRTISVCCVIIKFIRFITDSSLNPHSSWHEQILIAFS